MRKYQKERKRALDTISNVPGVTTAELATTLALQSGNTVQQMTSMLSDMATRHEFVRVRAKEHERFTYKCYMTVPPGVDPELFKPRKAAHRKSKGNGVVQEMAAKVAEGIQESLPFVRERVIARASTTEALADLFEPAHPAVKPGTFTVDLELPDGNKATFTLDEARRMYEQLYRLFGANGL